MGFIAAIPWLVMLLVQPLWGILADKYGKMRCLKISILSAVLIFLLFPLLGKSIYPIVILTMALALFNNPVLPLLDSLTLDQIDRVQNISYSNIRFWGAPGYGLGAVVTGWLIPVFGVGVAFYTSACFLVLCLLSMMRLSTLQGKNRGIDLEFKNLADILSNPVTLFFLFIIFAVSIGQSAITSFLSVYMREIGASAEIIGTTIGVQALSELPFYFIAAWLLTRMKPGYIVIIAIVATTIRLFLYTLNSNPNLVFLIEMMNGMTWTLLWISSVEFINGIIPAKWRTTGQSLLWAVYFGAGAISGNILSGWLYESMSMQRVFGINSMLTAGITIIAAIVIVNNNRKNKRKNV